PIHGLIQRLEGAPAAEGMLAAVRDDLSRIDAAGVGGNTPAAYAAIRATLAALPGRPDPARLFQVDLTKRVEELTLGSGVMLEIQRGLALLHRLARPRDAADRLRLFRERFIARYEEAELPLVEVLDEEIGIGFDPSPQPGDEPLLQGLDLPLGDP